MLITSASRPATLSRTMRRVRLDELCATRKRQRERTMWAARRSQPRETRGTAPGDASAATDMFAVRSSTLCYVRWRIRTPRKRARRRSTASRLRESAFLEAVTDAIERLDHVEIVVGRLELLAQPLDVAVDGPVIDIDLIVIGGVHQSVAALHHAGPARERLQDEEFGDRERHRFVLPSAGVALRVHAQQAALQHLAGVGFLYGGRVLRSAAAEHRLDPFDEKPLREWLLDEVVRAHLQAEQLVDLLVLGCQEDHRHVGLLAQPAQEFHAVHARHLDVEDGEVRRARLEAFQS